jgi:hypothetical protein
MNDMSDKILRQKAIAIRNQNRSHAIIYVGMAIFFAFLLCSAGIEETLRGFIAIAILATMFIIAWVTRKGKAKCPKCGFDWEIKEDESGKGISILNWNCCPGCGLKMPTANGKTHKP